VRDELIPEEVVDGALIRAYRQFLKGHAVGDVRSWLTRLAVDRLDEEINRLAAEREIAPVHIEEDIPETPPKEWVSSLGEEIMYFYQPDEDLKVEDTVPDPEVTTPEDEVAAKELRDCVTAALHEMPWESQRALLMHYGEDEPITRVADTIGKPEEEVRRILRYSSKYLRQRLIESGCTLTPRRRAA
jgi:RNA polymerase sigma factor (sigma-70 family)